MPLTLYKDLEARGLIKQVTSPDLEATLARGAVTLYCGFDPTADSLHVGSLLPLMTLRRFQDAGHRVVAVVGGATGMIGDPSFKSQERSLLDDEQIQKNLAGIREVISRILKFDGPNPAQIVNNGDWFKEFSFVSFLRDVGKHFTINHMMAKESVRARLEDRDHGISYTEFSYMLLQAYDFYHLYREQGCTLQIGGSDQWGNITAGTELIRRMTHTLPDQPETFGLTFPLVTRSDGGKFGKTEKGTVWLSANRTTPYQLYQFFLQATDVDVVTYLKYFTLLSVEEINELERSVKEAPEKRVAHTRLADLLVELIYGAGELAQVKQATSALFSKSGANDGAEVLRSLSRDQLKAAFAEAPSSELAQSLLDAGLPLVDALVSSELCSSKGMARKDIVGGGIYVNNERVTDPAFNLTAASLLGANVILLRKGKKSYHLLAFK